MFFSMLLVAVVFLSTLLKLKRCSVGLSTYSVNSNVLSSSTIPSSIEALKIGPMFEKKTLIGL